MSGVGYNVRLPIEPTKWVCNKKPPEGGKLVWVIVMPRGSQTYRAILIASYLCFGAARGVMTSPTYLRTYYSSQETPCRLLSFIIAIVLRLDVSSTFVLVHGTSRSFQGVVTVSSRTRCVPDFLLQSVGGPLHQVQPSSLGFLYTRVMGSCFELLLQLK